MTETNVCIGLCNPKSPDNVSSVMRAAGNFRVNAIFYTGTRYPRALKLNPDLPKMSRNVSKGVSVEGVNCLIDGIPDDTKIVCIEFAENAEPLTGYQHPANAFYIFGPEDGTLSQEIIDKADAVVYVPTVGCMNLAATVNVVLYDRLMKVYHFSDENELIRQSRDTNNNIKVKR